MYGSSQALGQPKKYVSFSERDSRSIEAAFHRLAEEEEAKGQVPVIADLKDDDRRQKESIPDLRFPSPADSARQPSTNQEDSVKVPVNEDFLFDVDIDSRELAPTYWLGPVYDVRRGTWFYAEGSSLRPCDENLATQLEEGYVKAKAWRNEKVSSSRSSSKPRPASWRPGEDASKVAPTTPMHKKIPSVDDAKGRLKEEGTKLTPNPANAELFTKRLFGTHSNSVVTYQDETVAWLLTDDFMSRMSGSVYQRFAGGAHLGGIKIVRGFSEARAKEAKAEADTTPPKDGEERGRALTNTKSRSSAPGVERGKSEGEEEREMETVAKRKTLERQMTNIIASGSAEDVANQEEETRKRDEQEIQDDYRDTDSENQGREIEHLILVTHGIGQRLGMKLESVNFIHDVNVLRKTLKSVYENSPDLQALNSEVDKLPKNCRIQVLPVVWRHLLDFPKQSVRQNRKEQDLSDADAMLGEEEYPSLNDITIEGVPAVRNLITDLALDILLYQSAYREHISSIVQKECNRVHKLFLQRNPNFKGKVSLIGHSLGSAILFDVLCRQKDHPAPSSTFGNKTHKRQASTIHASDGSRPDLSLDFDVEDFFCLGSPLGLFQMLKGRTIAGRTPSTHHLPSSIPLTSSPTEADIDPSTGRLNPYTTLSRSNSGAGTSSAHANEILAIEASSPKCAQLYNIFHPTDPIAYRVEPLISPAMSSLKPQPLPYTKRGIFGAQGAGLTGIGARVGQSVSGFWSNIATGVASSLLNRSLGLTPEGPSPSSQTRAPLSLGAGTNISGGGVIAGPEALAEDKAKALQEVAAHGGDASTAESKIEHPITLLDTEIETLYSGFQRRRKGGEKDAGESKREFGGESAEWMEAEERAKRLRREEAKVRLLNGNGRVDFSIQE